MTAGPAGRCRGGPFARGRRRVVGAAMRRAYGRDIDSGMDKGRGQAGQGAAFATLIGPRHLPGRGGLLVRRRRSPARPGGARAFQPGAGRADPPCPRLQVGCGPACEAAAQQAPGRPPARRSGPRRRRLRPVGDHSQHFTTNRAAAAADDQTGGREGPPRPRVGRDNAGLGAQDSARGAGVEAEPHTDLDPPRARSTLAGPSRPDGAADTRPRRARQARSQKSSYTARSPKTRVFSSSDRSGVRS